MKLIPKGDVAKSSGKISWSSKVDYRLVNVGFSAKNAGSGLEGWDARRPSHQFESVSGSWKGLRWVKPDSDESKKGVWARTVGRGLLFDACGWQSSYDGRV